MSTIPNLTGQMLGKYLLRARIGAGGMGAVYRAYQEDLTREVALKILPIELASEPGYLERFKREAAVSAALEHKHIVPVYDFGVQDDIAYVVMRLLTGGSLAERIAFHRTEKRLLPSLPEVAAFLEDIASALDYAHSKGIIHRDIKPNNVMFDEQGDPFLVDFGIAKLLYATHKMTAEGMVMGTPAYMAPEQWRADEPSAATDQYAAGVMTYELVTGRIPFEAPTPYGLMHKHLNEAPPAPQSFGVNVPEAITLVLNRALHKDRQARFETVTAFAQAFERAIASIGDAKTHFFTAPLPQKPKTAARAPASALPPAARPFYRSRWASGIAAMLLALVLIIVAFAVLSRGDEGDDEARPEAAATQTAAASLTSAAVIAENPTDTATAAFTRQPSATSSTTATATNTASAVPSETLTLTPTATNTATSTFTPAATANPALSFTPVPVNADWTPIEQDFNGVTMVLVPVGCFMMGSDNGESNEQPVHEQCFDEPFWIDKYEVTNEQFERFDGVADQVSLQAEANHPRERITWFEARDFCALRGARLATEREWEYAARGPDNLMYTWGNSFIAGNVVYARNSGSQSARVGSRSGGASWVGALDMSGNVWEWTSSIDGPYEYTSEDGRENTTDGESVRIMRGGSWLGLDYHVRASVRTWTNPGDTSSGIGFRCAQSYTTADGAID